MPKNQKRRLSTNAELQYDYKNPSMARLAYTGLYYRRLYEDLKMEIFNKYPVVFNKIAGRF